MFIDLVDKVRIKKNELENIKNLMNSKIKKIQKIYDKKMNSLEYKKRNIIISDQIYSLKKKEINKYYSEKISHLKNKFKLKNQVFEKEFDFFKNKISKDSLILKKENKQQEFNFDKKINLKIELNKNKNRELLKNNESYFKKIKNSYDSYENRINNDYFKFRQNLELELKTNKIGQDLFDKKLHCYEKIVTRNYEHNLKKHEFFSVPMNFHVDRIKSNSKTFGNYLNFKKNDKKLFGIINANKLIIAIIVLSLIVGFINPLFFSASN